ncbi:hypothetical protein AS589_09500 [Empedobacter brevis]|uniref:hypothetical protein n=1 Tax=Empedobacter brevis TaxID=247 RepID=UPI00131FF6A7|nr:hypothetical protein [Empedobacter brevis]QHC84990.1 hypothetical protein AS589_09500 [Empedobacter brevis]
MSKLFITAFLQVFFVSANTYFIAKSNYLLVGVCGFIISWLWTSNVKKISTSTTTERIVYATGAAMGGLSGLLISKIITHYLN